jgi:hypothetical protein
MAKVKLGRAEFAIEAEEMRADRCEVPHADVVLFADRVQTGEIGGVKRLFLVIFLQLVVSALRQR